MSQFFSRETTHKLSCTMYQMKTWKQKPLVDGRTGLHICFTTVEKVSRTGTLKKKLYFPWMGFELATFRHIIITCHKISVVISDESRVRCFSLLYETIQGLLSHYLVCDPTIRSGCSAKLKREPMLEAISLVDVTSFGGFSSALQILQWTKAHGCICDDFQQGGGFFYVTFTAALSLNSSIVQCCRFTCTCYFLMTFCGHVSL